MNEFDKSVRGYAAAGIPQVENAGDNVYIVRWGIEPNIVDGEQQGVKFLTRSFKGMPTLGDLVDAMVRVQRRTAGAAPAPDKPDEFAEYNGPRAPPRAAARRQRGRGRGRERERGEEKGVGVIRQPEYITAKGWQE